jgi:hypothetical protein
MEMAVRSMETAETAMETDGDGSGGTSPLTSIILGFSVGRLFIGEGALSGGDQGGHTIGGHSQGLGRAPLLCGQPLAPLRLSFGLRSSPGKNKTSGTCFV